VKTQAAATIVNVITVIAICHFEIGLHRKTRCLPDGIFLAYVSSA